MSQHNTIFAFLGILLHAIVVVSQEACSSDGECGDIFREDNELMMLQFRSTAKSRADIHSIENFQTVGAGCCSGEREESNGKLWAGATDNLDACKAKCLEFEGCGAVEYGWTAAHTHWCFIWSTRQNCSSLDSGDGKCGPGGSTGVQAYRFSPGVDLQEAVAKAAEQEAKKKAQQAEQKAVDVRAAAAKALKEAQEATAAAAKAELNAAEAAEHTAYENALKKAKAAEDAKGWYDNATRSAEEKENEATSAAEAAEKMLQESKIAVLHSDKMSKKAHHLADKAHKAAEVAQEAARLSVEAQEATSKAAEKAAEEREEAEKAEAERQEAQKAMKDAKKIAAAADAIAKAKAQAARQLIAEKHREQAESEKEKVEQEKDRADEAKIDMEMEKARKAGEGEEKANKQKIKVESSLLVQAPDDFHSLGAGCCTGARSKDNGKLWAGERSNLTSCAAKCREFQNCGAIEYGWDGLNNNLWCFIWSSQQNCSYLEVGPGACGNGGSNGVHAFRFGNDTKKTMTERETKLQASTKNESKQAAAELPLPAIKTETKESTVKNQTEQAKVKKVSKQATIKNQTEHATTKNVSKHAAMKNQTEQATLKSETKHATMKNQRKKAATKNQTKQAESHNSSHFQEMTPEAEKVIDTLEARMSAVLDEAKQRRAAEPHRHLNDEEEREQREQEAFARRQQEEDASGQQVNMDGEKKTAEVLARGAPTKADMTAHELPLAAPLTLDELKKKAAEKEAQKGEKKHLDVDMARELESQVIGWDELGEGCCYGQRGDQGGGKLRSASNVFSLQECQRMCLDFPDCGTVEFSKQKPFTCFIWSDKRDCELLPASQCATATGTSASVYTVKRRSPNWRSDITDKQVVADEKYIDFQDYGSGCCLGKRDARHGKLFEGAVSTLSECQEKCRKSENCGAIEYGGNNNGSEWCFVWSTHQTCTDMAWGEDDCGQGGNEGVHVWKYLKKPKLIQLRA